MKARQGVKVSNLGTGSSRRWLIGGGAVLLTGGYPVAKGLLDHLEEQELIRSRQAQLDDLCREMPCPEMESWTYDHKSKLIHEHASDSIADRIALDESLKTNGAVTTINTALFAQQQKSRCYFFPAAFEPITSEYQGKRVDISVRSHLRVKHIHESFHAKYNFAGLDVGQGKRLDATNHRIINKQLVDVLIEKAYIDTYWKIRDSGEDDNVKIWAALNFGAYTLTMKHALETLVVNQEQADLFNIQLVRMNETVYDSHALLERILG